MEKPVVLWNNGFDKGEINQIWEEWKYERMRIKLFLEGEAETSEEREYVKESGMPETLDDIGLSFFYRRWDDKDPGCFIFQFSTGGPGDELRFYVDPGYFLYRAEYVYLDWAKGVAFDVTNDPIVRDFWEYLREFAPDVYEEE